MRYARPLILFLGLILLAGCASTPVATRSGDPNPEILELQPTSFDKIDGWDRDRVSEALPAMALSCKVLGRQPDARQLGVRGFAGSIAQWKQACAGMPLDGGDAEARAWLESHFRPWQMTQDGEPQGLFTGYYEPELHGSWTADKQHTVPLYRVPPERKRGPTDERAKVAAGSLAGRGLELMWVDDPVEAFFLEIQGSGRIVMTDGTVVRVGYAGQNGRPYVPIGKYLADEGEIPREQVSLQSIHAWMNRNPARMQAVLNKNPSVVFFEVQELPAETGPKGAQGIPLTPIRSLAVDKRFTPYGAPLFLQAENPLAKGARLRRLVVAQDTGGAIKGAVRGDLFWGWGLQAEEAAGLMKSKGTFVILLPAGVKPPVGTPLRP